LLGHPEWLAKQPGATKSAMWYWWSRGLNELADKDDLMQITRKINGGYNGLENRRFYLTKIKSILL
jgi:putative chitinase